MNTQGEIFSQGPGKYSMLFALILVTTIGLRLELINHKDSISHDEAITYLAATCHQGEYSQYVFDGLPAPASTWKAMLQPAERFCFQQISADLGKHDIHPPLYFWLLHLWSLAVGVGAWTGPALNTIIAALTTVLIYLFARDVLNKRSEAILVTFTYALNTAVISVSGLARQYDLLILVTLLVCWTSIRYAESRKHQWRELWPLLLLSLLGGLTHYHFFLPLTACIVYLFVKLKPVCIRSFFLALGTLATGFLSSFIAHPYFISSVDTELGFFGALQLNAESFLFRLMKLMASFGSFYYLAILLISLALWLVARYWKDAEAFKAFVRQTDLSGLKVFLFAPWIGGGIVMLYLGSITPLHQMSPKYFAMAWPFISFAPVFILRLVRQRKSIALYLYLFPLLLSVVAPIQRNAVARNNPSPDRILAVAKTVIVDNVARGIFPRIVWYVPDASMIIAAPQRDLLNSPDAWLNDLGDESVYVSEISYGGTKEGQMSMLGLLEGSGYVVKAVDGTVADAGTVFAVHQVKLTQ